MHLMIREVDRRAMDLVMDRTLMAASKAEGKSIHAAADAGVRERAGKVEKVLGLLDHLIAADPPANMLNRTLRFIEASSGHQLSGGDHAPGARAFNPPPPFA